MVGSASIFHLTRANFDRPPLTREGSEALKVWDFCEGWEPERLPFALAFFDVSDPDLVIELLLEMRTYMAQRAAAEKMLEDFSRGQG